MHHVTVHCSTGLYVVIFTRKGSESWGTGMGRLKVNKECEVDNSRAWIISASWSGCIHLVIHIGAVGAGLTSTVQAN